MVEKERLRGQELEKGSSKQNDAFEELSDDSQNAECDSAGELEGKEPDLAQLGTQLKAAYMERPQESSTTRKLPRQAHACQFLVRYQEAALPLALTQLPLLPPVLRRRQA